MVDIREVLNLDLANFSNRQEFIDFLSESYEIHPHQTVKIIIIDDIYCYKIGIHKYNLRDNIFNELKLYNKALDYNFEGFFEKLELMGNFKNFPANKIYRQKKLIIDKDLNFDILVENWIEKFGKNKVIEFNKFLDENNIWDLHRSNIGYDPEEQLYKLIDYEPYPEQKRDDIAHHKDNFNEALKKYL